MKMPHHVLLVAATILVLAGCSATPPAAPEPDTTESAAPAPADGADGGTGLGIPTQTVDTDVDCSLYSFDEISTLWGVPITDNDVTKVLPTGGAFNGKLYGCDYNETDSGAGLTVELSFREYDTADGAIQYMNDIRDGASSDGVIAYELEDVAGLGDEAFYTVDPFFVGTDGEVLLLYTRTDNLMLLLSATNLDGIQPGYKELLQETYRLKF